MSWFKNIAKYSKSKSNKKMMGSILKAASKAAPKVTRAKKGMRKKGKTMQYQVALAPASLKVLQGKKPQQSILLGKKLPK